MEYIGGKCFENSGIEEIALPRTLKEIDENLFDGCTKLKTVWVEDGCAVDVKSYVGEIVNVRCK